MNTNTHTQPREEAPLGAQNQPFACSRPRGLLRRTLQLTWQRCPLLSYEGCHITHCVGLASKHSMIIHSASSAWLPIKKGLRPHSSPQRSSSLVGELPTQLNCNSCVSSSTEHWHEWVCDPCAVGDIDYLIQSS